jgi:cystathionine gamma-synthase
LQEGKHASFEYGRYGNPTTRAAEEKIRCAQRALQPRAVVVTQHARFSLAHHSLVPLPRAFARVLSCCLTRLRLPARRVPHRSALEGAEDCLLSASGMCSATTMLLALVPAGGHIVTTTDCYRRTRQFIQTLLPKMGITTTVIDPSDMVALKAALAKQQVSLFFSESPTNPYLRCVDVRTISTLCHAAGATVCIDSTFATPCNQRALALGADLVLHSATKYLAGHNDLLAGAVAGKAELVAKVRALHAVLGGVIDPHAAYLLLRGLKTLSLRVTRHNENALRLARVLEAHPKIARVHYPGLASHPDHAIASAQMSGFGGVVSFEVKGDLWTTAKFIDGCRLPYIAPSLGGVESLIEQPTIISYWDQGPEKRAEIGIKDNLVRFSAGVEDYADIEADILQALEAL